MDLLGGIDMSQPAQPQPAETNALDLFNNGGEMGGALGAAAAQNNFGGNHDPFAANQNAMNIPEQQ